MVDAEGNRYGPYDIEVPGSEAEALTEDAWYDLFGHISGVKTGGELTFTGLTAHLAPIDMRVHGSFLSREDEWTDASPPTSTAAPRRDMLVARRQRTTGEGAGAVPGTTFLTVLRGTPASTPAEPTDYDPDNDEPLWSWQVPGNGGTVVTAQRDLRGVIGAAGGPKAFVSFTARNTHFPSPARGDTCTVNGITHTHDGTAWKWKNDGRVLASIGAPTTDAGGFYTFPHGLGVTPSNVHVTTTVQASDLLQRIGVVKVNNWDAANVVVGFIRTDTSAYIPNSLLSFDWTAKS